MEYNLPKQHAEALIKRSLAPLMAIKERVEPRVIELDENEQPTNIPSGDTEVTLKLSDVRNLINDISVLGMGMAGFYKAQADFETTLITLAHEVEKMNTHALVQSEQIADLLEEKRELFGQLEQALSNTSS